MKLVQPFRSKELIRSIREELKNRSPRDHALFVLGIYTGLRISDLLKLKVEDVATFEGAKPVIRERLDLREKKTGKGKIILLNPDVRSALKLLLRSGEQKPGYPLFVSRKRDGEGKPKAIGRWQANNIVKRAAKEAGVTERIGTHSLRKTFGYHLYRGGSDVVKLQKLYNHASPQETLSYIGFTQDEFDEVYLKLRF